MFFKVYGPLKLNLPPDSKLITKETLTSLIAEVEETEEGLSKACGCYVFGVRASKGIVPWYVGQTNKELVKEALNSTNMGHYNRVMEKKTGTPVLFLVPKFTPTGRFGRSTSKPSKAITFLEEWLIANALKKNQKLINSKKTFFIKNVHVTGILNATHGTATVSSSKLKKTLGL